MARTLSIDNTKYSIQQAFRECFYVIPDYQREYVWTDKEVTQLLDDINDQIEASSEREYFIGTVLVSPRDQAGHYDVIDGQQRLTTFFLLLTALKHLFNGQPQRQQLVDLISTAYTDKSGETLVSLKLDLRYENAGEVIRTITEVDGDAAQVRAAVQGSGIASFGSLENILAAYTTIYKYLMENYSSATELKKYWGYLSNNVIFIQIATDISSALKIFETINERGVGLNPMDLLKNLLFTQVPPEQFAKLKDDWKNITKPLEKAKEKPLRFLRYFLMANYEVKTEKGDGVIYEDKIYDWLTEPANAAKCAYKEKPFDFIRKITRNVDHYIAFIEGRGNDGKPNTAMESLKLLTGGAFSLHYVLLLAVAPLPNALFDHFVRQLESFLFTYIFTKTPTKDLEKSFSVWADELRAIARLGDAAAQEVELDKFIVERFQSNMDAKAPELADALKRLTLHSMQQYRTRYLLARLTQYVDLAFSGVKTPGTLEPYVKLEIEHILPDTPTDQLRASWTADNPKSLYDEYKNRLGNLTLLEKPINIVAGNDFYAKKMPLYEKSGNYLTRSLTNLAEVGQSTSITRINEKLKAFSQWNGAAIDDRHALLIALAGEIWKTSPIAA